MSVDKIVTNCLKDIPKAVAAGVVDMGSGMLLGVKTVDSHPQEVLDLIAAATKDMFEGDNMGAIATIFSQARGLKDVPKYVHEIIFTSQNLLHILTRLKNEPTAVVVVVARVDTNLGLALMKARAIGNEGTI